MSEPIELGGYRERTVLVEDPCPHGIPAQLCADLCAGDPSAVVTVRPDRPVGHALALDCQLAGAAPELLSDAELFDVVEGAERQQRWAGALRTRMIAEIAARHPRGSRAAPPDADPRAVTQVSRWLPDHLGMVLGVGREQALGILAQARRFGQVLPATLAEWEAGRIDERKADTIADATVVLDDETAAAVEATVLAGAAQAHHRLLRDRLRRAIAKADPEGAARRHQRARAERRMSINRGEEGMASLWLSGTAEQTEASWRCVDRLARSLGTSDPRTLDQKRVDLAHELLQGTLSVTDLGSVRTAVDSVLAAAGAGGTGAGAAMGSDAAATAAGAPATVSGRAAAAAGSDATAVTAGAGAETSDDAASAIPQEVVTEAVARALATKPDPNEVIGRKPLIHVVVALDTLMGGDRPAELVGYGPIPAVTARALAAGGVWKRLVTEPRSGALLDHCRTTYSPPEALDDFVRARYCTCRGPLCSKPIRDLDHHIPWAGGEGPTSAENLHGFCLGDHKLKDAPGWQVLAHPDGSLTWISPCGRRRTTHPHDYRPYTDPMPDRSDRTTADIPGADGDTFDAAGTADAADAGATEVAGTTGTPGGGSQGTDERAVPDDEPPF